MQAIVEASGPSGLLRGVYLQAQGPDAPLIIVIPGSGPTDCNGNSPLGLNASTYRLLAEALQSRGVSTLRIDKRGMYSSATVVADADSVTIDDYAEDVRVWMKVARNELTAKSVWLLGHSEGGLVAMLAARISTSLAGLVLIAASGRPLGTLLRAQLRANRGNTPLLPQAVAAIDALEKGQTFDTGDMHPALLPLFRPAVQHFLMSAFALDPCQLLEQCSKPILILHGLEDIQV